MANRAYLGVWTRDFGEPMMIEQFVRFLATAPLAASDPYFSELVVQSIGPAESPAAEWDLRGQGFGAAEVAALAAQHSHADTAYTVEARWDLWQFDAERLRWEKGPSALTITCQGPEYDDGAAATAGDFLVDLGFEHLFTGHAGLLGDGRAATAAGETQDSTEHRFARWMCTDDKRREYHTKTRENIQQLMRWVAAIESALPVERVELWSEGEENFEARLDAILARRESSPVLAKDPKGSFHEEPAADKVK